MFHRPTAPLLALTCSHSSLLLTIRMVSTLAKTMFSLDYHQFKQVNSEHFPPEPPIKFLGLYYCPFNKVISLIHPLTWNLAKEAE